MAAQVTRPDICLAAKMLSRFSQNSDRIHCNTVKRVMRYLKGTNDRGLIYNSKSSEIVGFLIDLPQVKSSLIKEEQLLGQHTIALSTAEAELIKLVLATRESI